MRRDVARPCGAVPMALAARSDTIRLELDVASILGTS